jgi:Tfp pilus assembly protein PilO
VTAVAKLDLSPRATSAAFVALLAVLAAATWFLVVSPRHERASDLDAQIAATQTEIGVKQHQSAHAAGTIEPADIHALERAMPDLPEMPQIVVQLDELANRAGVVLDTVTPQAPVALTGYQAVPMTVVVDGEYFGVQRFLKEIRSQVKVSSGNDLHASGRLYDVQAVDLQQTEPAPQIRASLTMQAFVFSGGAASASDAAATTATTETTAAGAGG